MPTLKELEGYINAGDTGGLKGLPSIASTNRDENNIPEVKIDSTNNSNDWLNSMPLSSQIRIASEIDEAAKADYNMALSNYKKDYYVDQNVTNSQVLKDIKDTALIVSPYYKKFANTSKLENLTDNGWQLLAAEYSANKDVYGEDYANNKLNLAIKDEVARNQSVFESAWYGFKGIGASAAGSLVGTAGMIKGAIDYFDGDYQDVEGLNGWRNFWNSVLDNEWTRYGNDMVQYGAYRPEALARAKELGLSDLEIIQTAEEEDRLLSWDSPFIAMQQGGFTVASMLTGAGLAKLSSGLFGLGKRAAFKAVSKKGLQASKEILTKINKLENTVNKFAIPGLVGTSEGALEGLSASQEVRRKGLEDLDTYIDDIVNSQIESTYGKPNARDSEGNLGYLDEEGVFTKVDDIFNSTKELIMEGEEYKDAISQIEYAGAMAGTNTLFLNSAVNGLLNTTVHAGLQAPSVQKVLQNSKLFKWAQPKLKYNITGEVGTPDVKVTPKFGKAKMAFNILKEPAGEFTEEYLQSVIQATAQGGAENNIHQFIENKYLGDGSAAIGDTFASDWGAAWSALGESLTDKETIKSGIYGALSSIIGTPTVGRRTISATGKGKTWGRGLNEKGELESNWEMIQRLTPWRSGAISTVNEARRERNAALTTADALQDWLRDPVNKGKFDGLVGTYNWAQEMGNYASTGDELGYKNSVLGKTINDAFMLEKLRGTQYYDAFMKELSEISTMELGSETAEKYYKAIMDNENSAIDAGSKEEVITTLKDNANLMRSTLDKIIEESDRLDTQFGNLDEDTKQSLIYGQLMLDRQAEDEKAYSDNIRKVQIGNSREESTPLTKEQKEIISQYPSLKAAMSAKKGYTKQVEQLQKDIDNLTKIKYPTDSEKKSLKEKKAKLKVLNKTLKKFNSLSTIEEGANTVLNEAEIMALDPISRMQIFVQGKKRLYNTYNEVNEEVEDEYYSPEQQAVIDNLIEKGNAMDPNFYNNVVNMGRVVRARETFLKQYNAILMDRSSFNRYVTRAKQAAADAASLRRYEAISKISDYRDFAEELDNIRRTGTQREATIIESRLKKDDNTFYRKYSGDRETIEKFFNRLNNNGNLEMLSENDLGLITSTLKYLSDEGVAINDIPNAVTKLSEMGDDDRFKFESYLDTFNASLPEDKKIKFSSIGEVIQDYKDAMDAYNKDAVVEEANTQEIPIEETSESEDSPAEEIEVKVASEEESIAQEETKEEDKEEKIESKSAPTDSSYSKVTNIGFNIADGISDYSEEDKTTVKEIIASLDNDEQTPQELSTALIAKSNQIESSSEDETKVPSLLRYVAQQLNKITTTEDESQPKRTLAENIFESLRKPSGSHNKGVLANPNAKSIDTSDIESLRAKHPNNAMIKYWDKYGIQKFLKRNTLKLGKDSEEVFFLTDTSLAQEVMDSMAQNGATYTDLDIPIVLAVKSSDGPIIINGERYQPIGTLPSTNTQGYNGTIDAGRLRELSKSNEEGIQLVKYNGKPIKATLESIHAKVPAQIPIGMPRKDLIEAENETLSSEEMKEISLLSRAARFKNTIFKRLKQDFLSKVRYSSDKNLLFIEMPNLKGESIPIWIFRKDIADTIDRNSDRTILDLFNSNDVTQALMSNHRLHEASIFIHDFVKSLPDQDSMSFYEDESGNLVSTPETQRILSGLEKTFRQKMGNYLSLPNQNWGYRVTPIGQNDNGDVIFGLSLTFGDTSIRLGEFSKGELGRESIFGILKNMLVDNGRIRMFNGRELYKWQIDYPSTGQTIKDVIPNIAHAYDDGILEICKESLEYTVSGVSIRSPFTSKGEVNEAMQIERTANPNNATSGSTIPKGQVQIQGGVVDTDTGAVVEGNPISIEEQVNSITPEPVVEKPTFVEPSITFDDDIGLEIDTSDIDNIFGIPQQKPKTPPIRLAWGRFEGFKSADGKDINIEESMKNLESIYTKEQWDDMTQEEQEHELNCKGVFN